MALLNLDNPFTKLKFRYLALRFILISLLTVFIVGILKASGSLKLNQDDLVWIRYIILFVLLCLWLLKDFQRLRIKLKYVVGDFPKNQNWFRLVGLALLAIIFSAGTSIVLFNLLSLAAPDEVEKFLSDVAKPSVNKSNSFESNLLVMFATCVVAPITEEFIFRGIILQRFCTKWGIRAGLLSSSLLFGCLHFNFIGLSLVGIILGMFYIKTRSLIVPIAFHAMNNIFAFSLQLFPRKSLTYTPDSEQLQSLHSFWWVGVILMAISLPFLLRFLRSNWPSKNTVIPYFRNANKEKELVGDGITH